MLRFNIFSIIVLLASGVYSFIANSENIPGSSDNFNQQQQSVNKFQDFTNDFLRESFASVEFRGANVIFPFGVAHLLTVLNEQKVWNISTTGVDYALWTSKENLTQEYAALLTAVNKQSGLRGVITSWSEFLRESEPLQKLNVKLENKRVALYDNEENQNSLPPSSWDHSQRNNAGSQFRKALFANTMFMPNYWFRELAAVGRGVFNGEVNTPFLESKGYLRNQETEDFIAVSLPLATFGQNLVLVLPKTNLASVVNKKNLQHYIQHPPTKSSHWTFDAIRVYVPSLNFITPGNFLKPLSKLGVQQMMCNPETETQLQPISQASYVYLGSDGFDLLTITSADYINVTEYNYLNNVFRRETVQRKRRSPVTVDENTDFFKKFGNINPLLGFGGSFDADLLRWAAHDTNNPTPNTDYRTIAFNQPFYWYLHDENIGPIFSGIVESIAQIPKSYYDEPFTRKAFKDWIKDMDATYDVPKCS